MRTMELLVKTLLTLAAITAVFCMYEGLTYNTCYCLCPRPGIKATHTLSNIDVVGGLIRCSVYKRHFKFLFNGYTGTGRHFEIQFIGHNSVATAHIQGRRHNFESGGTNITVGEASRKCFGLYPPPHLMPFWGVQQLQREAYGEPIGQRC